MSAPIIQVENLGKRYRIRHQAEGRRYKALRDVLTETFNLKNVFRNRKSEIVNRKSVEDFWALRNVSFNVQPGEVVGIIGRNGAGKSTLLKILSRITEPTEGRVTIRGRVASLLEVGTGFHPELTGRENIFLNGAILGMSRAEIKRKFDEIVAFAEVEKFLDTPVKRYSSGMYVRLAFAVAAHLEPEILVVDEVLAVGDAEFQKKCLGKMQSVATQEGRTVLFVSHNMAAVQTLCNKGLYLLQGRITGFGGVDAIVQRYLNSAATPGADDITFPQKLSKEIQLDLLEFTPTDISSGESLKFRVALSSVNPNIVKDFALLIYSDQGVRVAILDLRSHVRDSTVGPGKPWRVAGTVRNLNLVEGCYSVGVFIICGDCNRDLFDLIRIRVNSKPNPSGIPPYHAQYRGFVHLEFSTNG